MKLFSKGIWYLASLRQTRKWPVPKLPEILFLMKLKPR